ncbi:nucleolar protein (nucleomorph) [Chroomonas mesostigmatica CCMP1168]|uniref:Nucleolar protein n=1 Tax=Chroomonas mesostigmatica CCMP1168 TaxID=1195612 RepID=J7G6G1_9CRYP|nr:nucleolar protein [Chroomonas mesostigmatica CCMP1168]
MVHFLTKTISPNQKKEKFFNRRIKHIITIIKNYENLDWNSSKKYYFELLKKEICNFYNYSVNLANRFFEIIPFDEILEFFKYNHRPRPLTIRFNDIKIKNIQIKEIMEKKGIKLFLDKNFSNFAAIINKKGFNFGGSPEYLAGYYTLQGFSSFFPIFALNPKKKEKILDLAAAPGGKSSYISQLMNNSGILVANDKNKSRLKSLVSNIHRLGIENIIITNFDGSVFQNKMTGFDKVLIDAPCTGTGIIGHDNRIKLQKIDSAVLINSTLQKRLLLAAIDSCKDNENQKNCIVYSTCSILIEENEMIIQYAIEKRKIKILPTGLKFGLPGFLNYKRKNFHKSMINCRRFYPHVHNVDGFFICKIEKLK